VTAALLKIRLLMKPRINPYKLFFYMAVTLMLAVGLLENGIEGQKWTQGFKPFGQFSMGLLFLCLGPALVVTALNARASENTGTIWRKTWPATLLLGGLALLGGVIRFWKLLAG